VLDISPIQVLIVLAIALLIFGPKRLPEMGRTLGRGIRDLRGGLTDEPEPVRLAQPKQARPSAEVYSKESAAEPAQPSEEAAETPADQGRPSDPTGTARLNAGRRP
jgi:sec-independent protein translocase protein TatA